MPARIIPFRSPDPFASLLSKRHAEEARERLAEVAEPEDRDRTKPLAYHSAVWAWFGGPHRDDPTPGGSAA
jgi:transglutaminase-like putative cysteine protease